MRIEPTGQLDRYIRARYPVIAVLSHEENQVLSAVKMVAEARNGRNVFEWSYTTGLRMIAPNNAPADWTPSTAFEDSTAEPSYAFFTILEYMQPKMNLKNGQLESVPPFILVMKDLHQMFSDAKIVRYLRDIVAAFQETLNTVILVSPYMTIPRDLEKSVVMLDWPLPDIKDLSNILLKCQENLPKRIPVNLNGSREKVIQAMQGLTTFEAGSVLLSAVAATGKLDEEALPYIVREKSQIIRKAGVL